MKKIFALTFIITSALSAQNKKAELIEVAQFGDNQPIGVAVAPSSNRVFVSFPHNEPFLYALTEIVKGKRVPYPDAEWNKYMPKNNDTHFYNVQDLYADDDNNLWVLDSKPTGSASVFGKDAAKEKNAAKGKTAADESTGGKFKLFKINLATNKVEKTYNFGGLPKDKSGLNDVRVDTSKNLAYLSDPALKAIVVLDLRTDKVRIALKDDASTTAENGYILNIDRINMIDNEGKPFSSNVNGIALTKDNEWFYYKPINKDKLYRIATKYLADDKLNAAELSAKVEPVADAGVTHGLECDAKGNIYFGHSPSHSIKYVSPDGKVHTLVSDSRIIWPDSFGVGKDGFLYFSAAQLNRQPKYNQGKSKVELPYRVFKVKMP
ncbi:L-dopachrome tautomerase-related protein [Flavobacterium sp. DG1-102-2]|uniref:SMP-30/gluconolactonase/LRE family protein n=1 Tax=Flavobacterium sp. DG1-102-2 TaxID=3081663 RepID=UPI002949CFC5|nr:L-dopachrome tautomerase-related protein [Flavobacterium sp. DG1-102-2]MDV6167498.1 L-dopachrome tautomerase-related protein [Flavobacterium sp. DG1-102-2]